MTEPNRRSPLDALPSAGAFRPAAAARTAISLSASLAGLLLFLAIALGGGPLGDSPGGASLRAQTGEEKVPDVLIVPITGSVGTRTVALAQRALREALAEGIRAVVFDINTDGGRVDSMEEVSSLVEAIIEKGVPTVAFVRGRAFSAGAYLALVSKEVYMAPGSRIGAIVPVIGGPMGTTQIPDDDARIKAYAAMRSSVRALMERRGGYSQRALRVGEGMTDPLTPLFDVSYEDKDGFAQSYTHTEAEIADLRAQGINVTMAFEHSRPVTLTADQAVDLGLARGQTNSLEQLVRDRFDVPMSSTRTIELSWSETAAGWISNFKFLLLLGGFVLLIMELKAPGVLVPGILGGILIGLSLFGGYLTGLADWTDALLMVGGVGLIAVELFLVPGLLIPGLAGFFCLLLGLVLSQQSFTWPSNDMQSDIMGNNLLQLAGLFGLLMVSSVLLWKFLPRIPLLSRVLQAPPDADPTGGATQLGRETGAAHLAALVGRTAVAASDLRPAGIVTLGTDRLDVVSADGWIDVGTEVVIREIQGNRIVVAASSPLGGTRSEPS